MTLDERLRAALAEDLGRGDVTTRVTVPPDLNGHARFVLKEPGVLYGLAVAARVFALLDETVEVRWQATDGEGRAPGVIGTLAGPLGSILGGERVALNLLQRLSGVATSTRRHAEALANSRTRLLDTRKTAPLWRDLDKAAVQAGGGYNHRAGLDDGLLIKDNHIAAVGSVREAVRRAREGAYLLKVECEVETLDELREALEAGADRVLLDNMTDELLREAVQVRDALAGHVSLEASGNMSVERLPRVAASGVDFVSVGALTHSAPALDISLKIERSV